MLNSNDQNVLSIWIMYEFKNIANHDQFKWSMNSKIWKCSINLNYGQNWCNFLGQ